MQSCWQRKATFPGALKEYIGLWAENTLAKDRRMDEVTYEIQPDYYRTQGWSTPGQASVIALLFDLSSGYCYSLSSSRHCSCTMNALIFSASVWFLQRKETSRPRGSDSGSRQLVFGNGTRLSVIPSKCLWPSLILVSNGFFP